MHPSQIPSLRAGQIIQDTSPPEVLNFNLDFNNNTLVIEFNEAVNPATFDPTGLIFTSGINSSSTYSVLAGEATRLTTAQSTTLEISLTDAVSNKIRSTCDNDTDISTCIGASQNTTFLSFGSGLINDITGRSFVASTEPLQVSTLEEDVTPPQIATFLDLNLETFQITVEFSEPVQLPVNLSLFTLHSAATGGINISLSEGQSIYANPADKTRVTFTLSNEDVVAIKTNINIGTALANTFLSALADAAEDFSDLLSASSSALRTTNVESDTLQPSLVNFSLDLDSGEIFFTFNDVINTMSLVPNRLTLKSSLADTFTNNSYTLTGGASPGPDDFTFTFRLSSTDLNAIKSRKALAVNGTETYIDIAMSGVFDVSGLPIVPVSGFIADLVTPDTTQPKVNDFNVDLHDGILTLLFSEVVDVATLDVTQITLQNTASATNETMSVTLTGGLVSSGPSAISVSINFTSVDLNQIKRLENLATNLQNSFLAVTNALVRDTNGNPVEAILPVDSLNASVYRIDMLPPVLTGFDFDANSGLLTLTFDETVNSSTLNVAGIIFQNSVTANISEGFYQLTEGSVMTSTSEYLGDHILVVNISNVDLNALKSDLSLATSVNNTFIRLNEGTVADNSGNPVSAIPNGAAVRINNYTADIMQPFITGFSIDLTNDIITVTFSETVLPSTFNASSLTLQSNSSGGVQYTLQDSMADLVNGPTLVIRLSNTDSNAIKSLTSLASDGNNTFLLANASLVQDAVALTLTEVPAIMVSNFTSDSIAPVLLCSTLDLDTETSNEWLHDICCVVVDTNSCSIWYS